VKGRTPKFYDIGKAIGRIDVRVSYRIIQLFSEGLYSSPNKAVEELVSNAWDAGAEHVHVILPADRDRPDAQIVVIDDGIGMNETGLREHWLLGVSNKRLPTAATPKGRKPIGKFGIGKLATYVLANRLTHITKSGGRYYSTTIDFRRIDTSVASATKEKVVGLSLRQLTESEAKTAVAPWISSANAANKALHLFGKKASQSWTVSVMSDLKPMAKGLSTARLRWVLETAMPLRDDFHLFLNGEEITSSKLKEKKIGTWLLGKDVGTAEDPLPRPAPKKLEVSEDFSTKDQQSRYGLQHPLLGRFTGFIEAYEDELTGKSEDWGHSNGFFVHVRGRLINVDDPGFGIPRNKLQHGTFSRFRMVVQIDSLDEELRSSRETILEGDKLVIARNVLWAGFNFARTKIAEHAEVSMPGAAMAARVAASPASLTVRPISGLLAQVLKGQAHPRYLDVPGKLSSEEQDDLLGVFAQPEAEGFRLVENVELTPLAVQDSIARYDVVSRVLKINTLHPFVAHFLNEFQNSARSLPLELVAMAEVLLEAELYLRGTDEAQISEVLDRRDQVLRQLAKTTGKKNAFVIAQELEEAANNEKALERELVNAFSSLGYEAIPLGGPKKPDGIATAHISFAQGEKRSYAVSLEAKSKEETGKKVSAKTIGISAVARQRDDYECEHAVVVGPDFPSGKEGRSALEKELNKETKTEKALGTQENRKPRTITLMRVRDLSRLVRLVPQKRVGLHQLQGLFRDCRMPDEVERWIDVLEKKQVEQPPYREILEVIWILQKDAPDSVVAYGNLRTGLRYEQKIEKTEGELKVICQAMMRLAGEGQLYATENSVEINTKPERVLDAIGSIVGYPPRKIAGKTK
jgi:hypothetical protein